MSTSSTRFHQRLLLHTLQKHRLASNALEKGFTLVELLVVLIIIAILVTLGIQNFTQTIQTAASTAARAFAVQEAKRCTAALVGGFTFAAETNLPDRVTETTNNCAASGSFVYTGGGVTWTVAMDAEGFPLPATS